jgi:hypothetical protein
MQDANREARGLYAESLVNFQQMQMDIAIAYCLEVIAGLDAVEGEPQRAAKLFGAAEYLREEIGTPVESYNLERVDRDLKSVSAALGEAEFETQRKAGRELQRPQVVSLALG